LVEGAGGSIQLDEERSGERGSWWSCRWGRRPRGLGFGSRGRAARADPGADAEVGAEVGEGLAHGESEQVADRVRDRGFYGEALDHAGGDV
jgi:hypothetical protein